MADERGSGCREDEPPEPRDQRPRDQLALRFAGEPALGRVDLVRDAVERRAHDRDPAARGETLVRVEEQRFVDAGDLGQAGVLLARVTMHTDASDHGTSGRGHGAAHDRPRSIEGDPSQQDVGDEPETRGLGVPPEAGGEHGER